MNVELVSLESYYDNSLALSYVAGYASVDPALDGVHFGTRIQRPGENVDHIIAPIIASRPAVIGFNTYVWNIEASRAFARSLKRALPSTTIVMGGMEATYTARELLRDVDEIDFVVIGEGEVVFADLVRRLLRAESFTGVMPGLAYRDAAKKVIVGGLGPTVTNLDDIPSPFEMPDFVASRPGRILYESYRGCAFRCAFCLYHRDYAPQRRFSEDRVARDLAAIREAGCSHVRFVDSTFNIPRDRAKSILHLLEGTIADISVEVSAEFFDAEMIDLLPRAGIHHIDIGLQSTNAAPLAAVNRTWFREDPFRRNLVALQQHAGVTLNVELIAGLPDDDLAGLRRSIDDAVSLWPDHVSVYRLLGLKGSDVERRSGELGLHFSPAPPYELLDSRTFSAEALKSTDLLTFAHMLLFNFGVGRYALRAAMDTLAVSATTIYEEFRRIIINDGPVPAEEAVSLAHHYAHGNRFDRELPTQLHLRRCRELLDLFFADFAAARLPSAAALWLELIDFGEALASLDASEAAARGRLDIRASADFGELAPWCELRHYSRALTAELRRQGALSPTDIADVSTVLFTVHPKHGSVAIELDAHAADVVDRLQGRGVVQLSEFDDGPLVEELRSAGVLLCAPIQ